MEELKFPLTFDQCPNCGGERRIANEVIQEQKDSGKSKEETKAWLFTHQSIIADMTKPLLQVPVVTSFYDVCVDCGTVYCIQAEKNMAMPQANVPNRMN